VETNERTLVMRLCYACQKIVEKGSTKIDFNKFAKRLLREKIKTLNTTDNFQTTKRQFEQFESKQKAETVETEN